MSLRAVLRCAAAACLLLAGLPCAAQEQDLAWAVSQAPADARLVATVRSMAELETSLKALAGPEADEPALVESLEAGLPPGAVDTAGPLVLVVPASDKGFPTVVLLRLKDEAKLGAEPVEGGILRIRPPQAGPSMSAPPPMYMVRLGPWVAFDNDPAAVKAVASAPARLTLSDADRAALGRRLVRVQANPKSLAAAARRAIADEERQAEGAGGEAAPPAVIKTLAWLVGLLDQTRAIVLEADVKPEGVAARLDVALAEGSPLLAAAEAGLSLDGLKGGLPAADGLVLAGWGRVDWARALAPMKALGRPLLELLTGGADPASRKALDDLWTSQERWAAVLGPDVAVLVELGKSGQGVGRLVETFAVKDPVEYRKLVVRQVDASRELLGRITEKLVALPGLPPVKTEVEFREAAETLEGLPVDVAVLKMTADPRPGTPPEEAARARAALEAVYGPHGLVLRMACAGMVGLVVGGDAEDMARAIRAARGGGPGLCDNPKVRAAVGRLPAGVCAAGVVSLNHYVYMMMSTMERAIAQAASPEVKAAAAGLAPLDPRPLADLATFGVRLDGRRLCLTLDVPQSEVRAALAAGKAGSERLMWYGRKQAELSREKTPAAK